MQYQSLKKVASSKLVLFAGIAMILMLLSVLLNVWFVMDTALSQIIEQSYDITVKFGTAFKNAMMLTVFIFILPIIAVTSIPMIGLFMIYKNARSDQPLKSTGYSLIRGYMIADIVIGSFSFIINIFMISIMTKYSFVSVCTELFVSLLISILSVRALTAAREIVTAGSTMRRISVLLPTLLIVSLCVTCGTMILTILANTVPSLTVKMAEYRLTTETRYYVQLASYGISLLNNLLFIILSFRARTALAPVNRTYEF